MNQEFPAAVAEQVTLENWRTAPFNQWAFHHVSEIVPSAVIENDPARTGAFTKGSHQLQSSLPDYSDVYLEVHAGSAGRDSG